MHFQTLHFSLILNQRQKWGDLTFDNATKSWSPNSDQYQISPHDISASYRIQVIRIKEMITKDELSWWLNKFSQLVLNTMYGDQ